MIAIISAFGAHATISKQAQDSDNVRNGLKDISPEPAQLYDALKDISGAVNPTQQA
jgi:type I restriction enzyme R subunit